MPQEIPPRLEFPVDVTEKEYIEASLIAARRIGSLRLTPVIVAAAAALCLSLIHISCSILRCRFLG